MDVQDALTALRQELESLDQQIGELRDRQADIQTTIGVLQSLGGPKPKAEPHSPSSDQSVQVEQAPDVVEEVKDAGPQAILRRLMGDRPGVEVDSRIAHEMLMAAGWQSNSKEPINVVRTALAAMAGRGEIVKLGRGKYAYEADTDATATAQQTTPPAADGTLNFAEASYPSGSYSQGTVVSALETAEDDPRRAFDPDAPHRLAANRDDQSSALERPQHI